LCPTRNNRWCCWAGGAFNPSDIAAPIRSVLRRQGNVSVIMGDATGIDLDRSDFWMPIGNADPGALRQIDLQLLGRGDAAPKRFERDPHDEMVESRGHDLVDRRAHAIAHHLHVLVERLLGIERAFLDGDAAGVTGHARYPQHIGLGLDGCIGRRHDQADTLSKA